MTPRLRFDVVRIQPAADAGRWHVSWRVQNDGPAPIDLQAAWLPHGRFRGDGRLPLADRLVEGARTELQLTVSAAEAPGTMVENAFLILRLACDGAPWRVFVRMRIEFDTAATPRPVIEAITMQPVAESAPA